jgi:hypothetical protein
MAILCGEDHDRESFLLIPNNAYASATQNSLSIVGLNG